MINVTTLELGDYLLDLVKIVDFKKYYYENLTEIYTSKIVFNSYLKAVDIPPKFFKEQPEETRDELLDNREVFVKEHKKYNDKVIVVARTKTGDFVNACRMVEAEALRNYERLKTIAQVPDKFEHRSFDKDGYVSYVVSGDIKSNKDNQVLVVDFPILLNKPAIIHKALYTLPNDTFATPVEHIHYLTDDIIDLDVDYKDIKAAINDFRSFIEDKELTVAEPQNILREAEIVALALCEAKYIPNSYVGKIGDYIKANTKGTLTTDRLESLVLDYDETFRSYKQVTALRGVSGHHVIRILESTSFKEFIEEMEASLAEEGEE